MTDRRLRRRRRLENAMRAFIKARGVPKQAAADFGVTERTMRELVWEYCREHGYETPVEAAYLLDRGENGGLVHQM